MRAVGAFSTRSQRAICQRSASRGFLGKGVRQRRFARQKYRCRPLIVPFSQETVSQTLLDRLTWETKL